MDIPRPVSDFSAVNTLMNEAVTAKAVMAAVELKLFDRLEQGQADLQGLAQGLGALADRLEPLLEILEALGLLVRSGDRYSNSAVASEYLVSTAPLYQGDYMALTMRFSAMLEQSIADLLRGGECDHSEGDVGWDVAGMMDGSAQHALAGGLQAVIDCVSGLPGFCDFRAMCDIGGNHGLFTMGLLARNKAMHGTIYDLPPVIEQARARCVDMGFGDRVTVQGFDLTKDAFPEARFDLALASHVLYPFKNDLSAMIVKIAGCLKPGGWFVSHHSCGWNEPGDRLEKGALELVTRLAGYKSHFIEKDEWADSLRAGGFAEPEFHPVPGRKLHLIAVARKPA
jgi:SAM-dependent methyltransferase